MDDNNSCDLAYHDFFKRHSQRGGTEEMKALSRVLFNQSLKENMPLTMALVLDSMNVPVEGLSLKERIAFFQMLMGDHT